MRLVGHPAIHSYSTERFARTEHQILRQRDAFLHDETMGRRAECFAEDSAKME